MNIPSSQSKRAGVTFIAEEKERELGRRLLISIDEELYISSRNHDMMVV